MIGVQHRRARARCKVGREVGRSEEDVQTICARVIASAGMPPGGTGAPAAPQADGAEVAVAYGRSAVAGYGLAVARLGAAVEEGIERGYRVPVDLRFVDDGVSGFAAQCPGWDDLVRSVAQYRPRPSVLLVGTLAELGRCDVVRARRVADTLALGLKIIVRGRAV